MENVTPKYKRVLLKLSGEALAKDADGILNFEYIEQIAEVLKKCVADGVQIAVVVGAGNIWRGRQSGKMDRARADQMGMLATAINSLALEETFNSVGLKSRAMMVMEVNSFADPYRIRDARRHLDEGEVVIIGGGTGMPFFSTDTAAAIHAAEIGADVILMAKNKANTAQAKAKLESIKMQAANEVGVNLKQGDNGDITARQAGSIGGQMVKKMIESYENGNA